MQRWARIAGGVCGPHHFRRTRHHTLRLLACLYLHFCTGSLGPSIFYTTVERPQKAHLKGYMHTIILIRCCILKSLHTWSLLTGSPLLLSSGGEVMRKGLVRLCISGPTTTVKGHCCCGWERLFQGHGYQYNKKCLPPRGAAQVLLCWMFACVNVTWLQPRCSFLCSSHRSQCTCFVSDIMIGFSDLRLPKILGIEPWGQGTQTKTPSDLLRQRERSSSEQEVWKYELMFRASLVAEMVPCLLLLVWGPFFFPFSILFVCLYSRIPE